MPHTDYANSHRQKREGSIPNISALNQTQQQNSTQSSPGSGFGSYVGSVIVEALKSAFKTIVVPTGKRFLNDVFEETKNAILWKNERPTGIPGYTPYNTVMNNSTPPWLQSQPMTQADVNAHRYDMLRAKTQQQAINILNRLYYKYRSEGQVTLAFYYQCFNEEAGTSVKYSFNDENFGWTTMNAADAVQTATGWKLLMPKLEGL